MKILFIGNIEELWKSIFLSCVNYGTNGNHGDNISDYLVSQLTSQSMGTPLILEWI